MPDADPAALLAPIRERADAVDEATAQLVDAAIKAATTDVPEVAARPAILARLASSFDVPALLKIADAALKLADDLTPQAPSASALEEDRTWIRQECADMIRAAITAALTEGEGNGQLPQDDQ